jgi:hypothetical protein
MPATRTRTRKTRQTRRLRGGETLAARNYGKVVSARQAELNALRQLAYNAPKNGPTYATLKANNARSSRNAELAALRGRRSVKNMVNKIPNSGLAASSAPRPNKKWFNYRAREGRSGTWTGSFSTVPGKSVYRVKNCGEGGKDPKTGLCKVKKAAHQYNYVA